MTDSRPLNGDTAVITGASAGIGRATAIELAEAGAQVVLAARSEDRLDAIAAEIEAEGGEALVVPTDVTEETAVQSLVETTVETFGSLDIVVANAGLGRGAGVSDLDTDAYRQMMNVNVDGVFFLTRAALPHLEDSDGNLVMIGSFAGKFPRPFNPVYAATKWWVRGFAKSVMAEVGDNGVGVSIINPSEVRTEFGGEDGEPFKERFEEGQVTEPDEIADAVRFAATQDRSTVAELDLFRRDKFSTFDSNL